jgi:hypothetical protein
MASGNPEIIYGVQLLDDLHNYFPDLLYNNQRFTTVQSVLSYITRSTRRRFDLFSYGRSQYNNQYNTTRNETDTKDDDDGDEEDDETEDDEEDNEAQGVNNVHVVLQSMITQPARSRRTVVPNASAAATSAAATSAAAATAATAATSDTPSAVPPASMPVTPPAQNRYASARGSSPIHNNRVQRSYASVVGGPQSQLFSLFPSFDNLIYSNLNIPTETTDQIDINMNLLSALAGLAPMNQHVSRSFLDPVPVFPTPAQIQAATTTRTLDADMDDNCSICQDTMRSGENIRHITSCNHTFHRSCIDTWFVRNVRCPVCRHDIRETGPSTSTSTAAPAPQQASNQNNNNMDEVE